MDTTASIPERMIEAAMMHVAFDGWSPATFEAAAKDADVELGIARIHFPRGAVDMAVGFHKQGDKALASALNQNELSAMRFRDRVAHGVRLRLEMVEHEKEVVRRGATLFALPQYASDGTACLWSTADTIWTSLGDTSEDYNWYTKRMTLSAVYGATVLYWLGDDSFEHQATWDFLDRRIDNVMQFEKAKGQALGLPVLGKVLQGSLECLGAIKKPKAQNDLPGKIG